jgi:hypothetical protein
MMSRRTIRCAGMSSLLSKDADEEIYRDRENDAQNDAGDDGKEEREAVALERNVGRKTADEWDSGKEE